METKRWKQIHDEVQDVNANADADDDDEDCHVYFVCHSRVLPV